MKEIRELAFTQRLEWLRLIRSENVGPITFFHLLEKYGSAGDALAALPELARKGGRKKSIQIFNKGAAERELEALDDFGGKMIAACEPAYPPALIQIPDPPPVISVKGHVQLFEKDIVGIVGSRNASAVALKLTQNFASYLGQRGIIIASGLARGIDRSAHLASLKTGTVAVVGGGIDIAYPKENVELQEEIANRGCLIAEQPLGVQPQARHFPRRNRIISGMSLGVVIMEATPKSGSLITARMAAEQGRDVFAVPGSPMDPRARGANNLIRNGAILVESPEEILQQLAPLRNIPLAEPDPPLFPPANMQASEEHSLSEGRPKLIALLSPTPVNIDDLIRLSELSPSTVLTILLELELAGRIERHFGNRVSFTS